MKLDRIDEKIRDYVVVGDKIAVAVSGGIDSMVLLRTVENCTVLDKNSFFVVNVEHGIRGETSKSDSAFVRDYCLSRGIEFSGISVEAKKYSEENKMTVEEAARALRYAFFAKLLDEKKCNKILLAHHRADQAETVLMRIIRGTGIQGLAGIRDINGGIVRPLIDISKQEITEYAKKYQVPFVVDETNSDNNYTRNLLRNEIIPSLEKISASAEGGLVRLSRIAAEVEDFIASCDNPCEICGEIAAMKIIEGEHRLLFKRRVKKCFEALGIKKDIEEVHYGLIYDMLNLDNGASLDMPFGARVTREYDKIVFSKCNLQNADITVPFSICKVSFADKVVNITEYHDEPLSCGELIFDLDKVPSSAEFRYRREGDKFTKFGGGTKSLGDYLTNVKVPKRERESLIILADGSDVLLIVGIEISDKIKVGNDTENKYKISLEA